MPECSSRRTQLTDDKAREAGGSQRVKVLELPGVKAAIVGSTALNDVDALDRVLSDRLRWDGRGGGCRVLDVQVRVLERRSGLPGNTRIVFTWSNV